MVNLILKKISKIGATSRKIYGKNAPKSISAGAPPQTPLRELTAFPQTPELYLRGLLLRGRRRRGKEEGKKRERGGEREGREGEGKGREGGGERPYAPPIANSWLRH